MLIIKIETNNLMPVYSQSALEKLFLQSKLRQQKKKEEEKKKYKKAQDSTRKAIKATETLKKKMADKLVKEQEKQAQKALKCHFPIYSEKYIDRFPADDELYQTREELMAAEERGEGEINWSKWDELITKVKAKLN